MDIPANIKFTPNDEWINVNGNIGSVGISDYAQNQLSDVVYVEITVAVGDLVSRGDACATLESVKAAADVYMPVSGKIVEVNEEIANTPELVNSDPYGAAWLVKVEINDPTELDDLLDASAYEQKLEAQS
jgi:glycine cleavage system H protein